MVERWRRFSRRSQEEVESWRNHQNLHPPGLLPIHKTFAIYKKLSFRFSDSLVGTKSFLSDGELVRQENSPDPLLWGSMRRGTRNEC